MAREARVYGEWRVVVGRREAFDRSGHPVCVTTRVRQESDAGVAACCFYEGVQVRIAQDDVNDAALAHEYDQVPDR